MKTLASALVFAFVVTSACADSWMAAKEATYTSIQENYRLTVFPGIQSEVSPKACDAMLEKLVDGKYELLWRKPLINKVSPVSALISDADGSFATFDNWYEMGYGDDVIVIYNKDGEVLKNYALTDIMSQEEYDHLPETVSSKWWSKTHDLDVDQKVLNVHTVIPDRKGDTTNSFLTIRIRLDTAEIIK